MPESTGRRAQRLAKLQRLIESGMDPYPARVQYTHTTAEAIAAFERAAQDEEVTVHVVGRLISIRVMGKSSFAHIADGYGRIQLY